MTFDEKISEDVSLSKILDCFIIENEKSTIIIDFLYQHIKNVNDILVHSIYAQRILNSDFVAKLNFHYVIKFCNILKLYTDNYTVSFLCWQIFQSNFDTKIKNQFRHIFNFISHPNHPYVGISGRIIQKLDFLFKNKDFDIVYVADKINSISDDEFSSLCLYLGSSLWVRRMLQSDFFRLLSFTKQYIFINKLVHDIYFCNYRPCFILNFIMQIMSEDFDVTIKYDIYHEMIEKNISKLPHISISKFISFRDIPAELLKLIDKSDSYPLFKINAELYGIDDIIPYIIIYAFFKNKLKFLFSMMEYDRELLENSFNICDILEFIKNHDYK